MEFRLPHDLSGYSPELHDKTFFMAYTSLKASHNVKIKLGYHAFIFVTEGRKSVSYPGGIQVAGPDHFFFLPAANCLMSEKTAPEGNYKSLLLFISPQAMAESLKALPSSDERYHVSSPLLLAKDDYILHFTTALELLESTQNTGYYTELMPIKVRELLQYLIARNTRLLPYFHSLACESPDESRIREAVTAHLQSPVTVEELAFICNMSLSTFKRKFEKMYSDSPRQWLRKAKIQRAAELLRRGKNSCEAADEVGYQDQSSFIRSFKKIYGVTPKQFKEHNERPALLFERRS